MVNLSAIREHAEVIGADGVHVGTVDRVEGGKVRHSANANVTFEEERLVS